MGDKVTCASVYFVSLIVFTALSKKSVVGERKFATTKYSPPNFGDFLYIRFVFCFFSENATISLFNGTILNKLIEMDDSCRGEDIATEIFFRGTPYDNGKCCIYDACSIRNASSVSQIELEDVFNASIAKGVATGSIDYVDVNNAADFLLSQLTHMQNATNKSKGFEVLKLQVIFVTDYATDAFRNDTFIAELENFKSQTNTSFIALTSAIDDTRAHLYFPESNWNVASEYTSWNSSDVNPICEFQKKSQSNFLRIRVSYY
jgi:hypothetical protein